MKILSDNKIANYSLIVSLGLLVVLMLSSFIIRLSSPPVSAELATETPKTNEAEQIIQVNILNACGKTGLANDVKNFLLQRGFDVVEIGNYDTPLDKSVIIDRLGDTTSSNKVAYAMGINENFITSEIDSTLYVRSTIIVGKDYFTLKPFAE
ncbi:hypothetical protein SDC9_138645 [bioreactor metagenome]|uniref:LytR/CpsA/Psr regulator C-terminal domain-containing protein n=1 Tax=bioreactor metagenome TaxID=1076179 RepID=A0A645DPW3_9ZZZZ